MRSLVLLLVFAGAASAAAPLDSQSLFSRVRGRVLQIRIVDLSSDAKAAIGSGFPVSPDGLVVSNYHVVSNLIHRPGQYRAEFVREDQSTGQLDLLAVDVVHDLALLQAEGWGEGSFRLAEVEPAHGEKIYALGNPFDLGFTIVEGTCNGLLENSLYRKIHFTGSINPGMSGGPALNRRGEVVGVNVSTAGDQVSFLVPSEWVAALLAQERTDGSAPEKLLADIRRQLLASQEDYLAGLLARPLETVALGDFRVPGEIAPFVRCWGDSPPRKDRLYEMAYQNCQTEDDIFVSEQLTSGFLHYQHQLYRSAGMSDWSFYLFLQDRLQSSGLGSGGDEEDLTEYACHTDFVRHDQLNFKAVYCLRGYRKLAGLYDLFLTMTTLVQNDEALQSTLMLSGVGFEEAVRFPRAFLETITWNRP